MAASLLGQSSHCRTTLQCRSCSTCQFGPSVNTRATGPKSGRCFHRRVTCRQANSAALGMRVIPFSQFLIVPRLTPSSFPASSCEYRSVLLHFRNSDASMGIAFISEHLSLSRAYRLHGIGVAGAAEGEPDPVSRLHLR